MRARQTSVELGEDSLERLLELIEVALSRRGHDVAVDDLDDDERVVRVLLNCALSLAQDILDGGRSAALAWESASTLPLIFGFTASIGWYKLRTSG